jgi:hypothetical protein
MSSWGGKGSPLLPAEFGAGPQIPGDSTVFCEKLGLATGGKQGVFQNEHVESMVKYKDLFFEKKPLATFLSERRKRRDGKVRKALVTTLPG